MGCFYADCHKTFMNHENLVTHMQKHKNGQDSIYYIKYIMNNMEEGKNSAVASVKREMEEKQELDEAEKTQLKEKLKKTQKGLEDAKGDVRHYRRRYDTSKEEIAKLAAELKDAKAALEKKEAEKEKLLEAKIKFECKLNAQKSRNEELQVS